MYEYDFMFHAVPVIMIVMFVLFIVILVIRATKGVMQWNKNNNSPLLTVGAQVVAKRIEVSHHHNHDNAAMHSSTTYYYVTFQVQSGDRMEFKVQGKEYGILVENDIGSLTFQGTRYEGFVRG